MPQVPELDYMSYITFEVYERSKDDEKKELAVRISLSEGAHSAVLDSSLDAKHALQVQPRRKLTGMYSKIHAQTIYPSACRSILICLVARRIDYIPLDVVIEVLTRHSKYAGRALHIVQPSCSRIASRVTND